VDIDPSALSLAVLLTIPGGVAFALVVRQFVEVLKAVFPALGTRVSGAAQAFVVSLVAYALAFLSVGTPTPENAFTAILAWLWCATGAVGIDAAWTHYRGGTT